MTNYRESMAQTLEFMHIMHEYKILERTLTDTEQKRREEIAQDMDDSDFKSRYGDRWKEVKMAVATKQAKNESVDEEVDLKLTRKIYEHFHPNIYFNWKQIIDFGTKNKKCMDVYQS